MKVTRSLLLVLFIFSNSSKSFGQFSLSGELRPRTEYSHGFGTLAADNQKSSLFTTQRSRLNFDYKMDLASFGLVLQDVRTWGSQAQLVSNQDFAVSIHQAWAEVNVLPNLNVKFGRQELAYDDQRIFGGVGWAQQSRSHDMVLFKYSNKINVHFGIAHHENTNRKDNFFDGADAYKDLQLLWLNKKYKSGNLSLFFMNNGKAVKEGVEQKTKYSQTIGTHVGKNFKKVVFTGNAYYQMGEDGLNKSLAAYNLMADLKMNLGSASFINVGYELLSGTDYNKTEKNNSFNPFYGTNHKFNGFMDYFYVGNHLSSVGLRDAYLKFTGTKNKTVFNADIHFFSSDAKVSATAKNYLGTELDFTLTRTLNQISKLTVGYSQMFGTESLELLKGGSKSVTNNWAYIMIAITPKFIN